MERFADWGCKLRGRAALVMRGGSARDERRRRWKKKGGAEQESAQEGVERNMKRKT